MRREAGCFWLSGGMSGPVAQCLPVPCSPRWPWQCSTLNPEKPTHAFRTSLGSQPLQMGSLILRGMLSWWLLLGAPEALGPQEIGLKLVVTPWPEVQAPFLAAPGEAAAGVSPAAVASPTPMVEMAPQTTSPSLV